MNNTLHNNSLKLSTYISWILVVCLFVLNSTLISNLVITLLALANYGINIKSTRTYFPSKLLIIFSFIISIAVGAMFARENAEFSRIIVLAVVFLSFPLKFEKTKTSLLVVLGVIFYLILFQLGSAMNIPSIDAILTNFYPIEDNVWSSNTIEGLESLTDNRYAGIYYNPNIMGQSMVLLYLIALRNLDQFSFIRLKFVISVIIFASILLTGSRTASFTFLIIAFLNFKKYFGVNFIVPVMAITSLFVLINLDAIDSFLESFRSFDLDSLYGKRLSSGSAKLEIFQDWLSRIIDGDFTKIIQLLFGIGVITDQFDFDLGYILQMFGVFGLMTISAYFYKIFINTPKSNRYAFLLFLISMGATIIVNFRFSILAILIFSMYQESNQKIIDNE